MPGEAPYGTNVECGVTGLVSCELDALIRPGPELVRREGIVDAE